MGAGVIGLSCAFALVRAGWRVTVIERNVPGGGASAAAAGMIAPYIEAFDHPAMSAAAREHGRVAAEFWPGFASDVEAASGQAVDYRMDGAVRLFETEDEAERARAQLTALGAQVSTLDPRVHAPVSPRWRAAVWSKSDRQVDPVALCDALHGSLTRRDDATVLSDTVIEVAPAGAVVRVRIEGGGGIEADAVVVAAGWRGLRVLGAEPLTELMPVKGQSLTLRPDRVPFDVVVRTGDVYLAPKSDGRVIVGATSEPGRDDVDVIPADTEALRARAVETVPALDGAPVVDARAGVRPGSRDHAPVLRAIAPRVIAALGHHRNGVAFAPASAARVCELAARYR